MKCIVTTFFGEIIRDYEGYDTLLRDGLTSNLKGREGVWGGTLQTRSIIFID